MLKHTTFQAYIYTLLIWTLPPLSVAQINTPPGATIPFGTNLNYPGTHILPTNLPTTGTYGSSQDAADAYNQWKSDYVESCGGTPEIFRVKFDTPSETVSEGIAYGMLLAAYAADKNLFDGLWQYYKNNMNGNGVMNWKIGGCTGTIGSGGATDAELDAANALLVANIQWPNMSSPHDYAADATTLINTIKDFEIQPINANGPYQTNNGDQWGFGNNCRNPSYQSPAYYKAYGNFVTSQTTFWGDVVTASYDLINANVHPTTGLVSNWSDHNGVSNSCNGPDEHGWDACRNPWRMGTDVSWYADPDAKAICNNIAAYVQSVGVANLAGPVPQNGVGGAYHSPTFISTWAVGVMGSNSSYQSTLNAIYNETVAVTDPLPFYFGNTLRAICLFNLTGNFWNPADFSGTMPNNAPIADIVASPISGNAPLVVNFDASGSTDADGDVLSYTWDFGDGITTTGITTTNTFTNSGVYVVTLTVDDGNGGTNTETITITVIDPTPMPPDALFVATPITGDYPLLVDFDASGSTDPNADPLTYTWNFGDGTMASGINPNHTFTTPGTYTVELTVSDGMFTDTYSIDIDVINTAPVADFVATPQYGQPPLLVNVDASNSTDINGGILTYTWDFGDGTSATGMTASHTYNVEGTFTITLTVRDEYGASTTMTQTVVVSLSTCNLVIHYRTSDNSSSSAMDNQVRPEFQIENIGTDPIDLSQVTFRYWFTKEGTSAQQAHIDYADVGAANVTTTFVDMPIPGTNADAYLEFGFTAAAGSLAAGSSSIQSRFHKTDWTNYDETNDYSYDMSKSSFTPWNHITAYCNGILSYGIEPIDNCPDYLTVNDNPVLDNTYQAEIELNSAGLVPNLSNVIMNAGNCILLEAEFEVELGAAFEAFISGCQ